MLMAAIAFNLKKYMKFEPVKGKSMAIALERELAQTFTGFVLFLILLFTNKNTKKSGSCLFNLMKDHEKEPLNWVVQQPRWFIENEKEKKKAHKIFIFSRAS